MANNLTDDLENGMLNWANPDVALPARPVSPLKVALFTVMPNQETGLGGDGSHGFRLRASHGRLPLSQLRRHQ
jgi:hypothetical protein